MKQITNREVIYGFKDYLDKQELSDEIGYSNRWIFFHLLNYRATLLYQKYKQNKVSDLNYQTIPLLSLEEVDNNVLKCIPPLKCVLLKTESTIPSFISLKSITTPVNQSGEVIKLTEIDPDHIKYKLESRLPAQLKDIYYYLQNVGSGVHVYIWSNEALFTQGVTVKAIFYEPHIVQAIIDCKGNLDPCYNYLEAEFPIDPELLSSLYGMALNGLLKVKTTASDIYNDGLDTISTSVQTMK